MALPVDPTTGLPPVPSAASILGAWSNPSGVKDPVRAAARTIAALARAIAGVMQTMSDGVTITNNKMADANNLMQLINGVLAKGVAGGNYLATNMTTADYNALQQRLIAAGVAATSFSASPAGSGDGGKGNRIFMTTDQLNLANKNIQMTVDNLSTLNQKAQLDLQTYLNRYNADIDTVSANIKASGTQAASINNNLRK